MAQSTSAARPKRAAEDFYRSHEGENDDGSNPSSKKPRFDHRNPSTLIADARDPEEDLILDADVIGKSVRQTKRNAVNIDGYESDSDNDNFDARAVERDENRTKPSADEEDDDMFADLKDEEDGARTEGGEGGAKRKKEVRFLNHDDIEGQVMNSKSGGKVSLPGQHESGVPSIKRVEGDEDEESSGDEELRDQLPDEMEEDLAAEIGAGGKKRHAPRLDAFNLKQEEEEGRFDESGNYVRKAVDPDAINDRWLEGLSKKDMKRAKEAHERREGEQRRKAIQDDSVLTSDILSTLVQYLDTGETPLEALQRLNKGKVKERKLPKWKLKNQRKDGMDVDVDEALSNSNSNAADDADATRKQAVDAITGAADALYTRGRHDVYDAEREMLIRAYRQETGEDWQAPSDAEPTTSSRSESGEWEYRWSDARDGGKIHGPYLAHMMKAWNEAGYFGELVEFRPVGDGKWSSIFDIN